MRAHECLRLNFEGKVPIDEWTEMKKKLDTIKKSDPRNINKQGVLEIDEFVEMVIL